MTAPGTPPLTSGVKLLTLLEQVADFSDGVRVAELARRTGMRRGTIHQQLVTLTAAGWMEQGEDGSYRLTVKPALVGHAALEQARLGERVLPPMERLAGLLGDSVSLAVRDRDAAMIVQRVEPGQVLRSDLRVGTRMPLDATASGSVMIAFADEHELAAIGAAGVEFPAEEELTQVRRMGYAQSSGRSFVGITAAATPIFNGTGACIAALSVSSAADDFDQQRIVVALMSSADEINRLVGGRYRGPTHAPGASSPRTTLAHGLERQPIQDSSSDARSTGPSSVMTTVRS